jgi:hypothetical protein
MPLRAYIFEGSNDTFTECIERSLFGSHLPWPLAVRKGDICFLYHYGTNDVLAVWEASSDAGRRIEPQAWGGGYGNQVRVKLMSKEIITVPRYVVNDIIRNPATGRVDNILEGYRAHNLIQFFASKTHAEFEREMALDDLDKDYRNLWPPKFICEDGHRVRSQGEKIIDDWLFRHQVLHAVEPIFPNLYNLIPDFMVYDKDGKQVFIEYWGMESDPTYKRRMEVKYKIYQDHKLTVIGVKPEDLQNIDEAMRADLKKHRIPIPF